MGIRVLREWREKKEVYLYEYYMVVIFREGNEEGNREGDGRCV